MKPKKYPAPLEGGSRAGIGHAKQLPYTNTQVKSQPAGRRRPSAAALRAAEALFAPRVLR